MKIEYKDIILRDMTEADIEDDIRWNTVETDWANWDAPWESLPDLLTFNPEEYRKKELEKLSKPVLYDWLKSAGYSGDTEANEFVENLLKNRKARE